MKAGAERFDLVFSDVMMPGQSGIEFADDITSLYPELRILLTSGYSQVIADEGSHGFALLRKPTPWPSSRSRWIACSTVDRRRVVSRDRSR